MENYLTRAEHNEYVKRMEDEHKRMNHRISELEDSKGQMQDLINNVGIMATNMKHMAELQNDQNDRLERLENIPNQNWNTIKNAIFGAIGATIGGAIISAIIYFL